MYNVYVSSTYFKNNIGIEKLWHQEKNISDKQEAIQKAISKMQEVADYKNMIKAIEKKLLVVESKVVKSSNEDIVVFEDCIE